MCSVEEVHKELQKKSHKITKFQSIGFPFTSCVSKTGSQKETQN